MAIDPQHIVSNGERSVAVELITDFLKELADLRIGNENNSSIDNDNEIRIIQDRYADMLKEIVNVKVEW